MHRFAFRRRSCVRVGSVGLGVVGPQNRPGRSQGDKRRLYQRPWGTGLARAFVAVVVGGSVGPFAKPKSHTRVRMLAADVAQERGPGEQKGGAVGVDKKNWGMTG